MAHKIQHSEYPANLFEELRKHYYWKYIHDEDKMDYLKCIVENGATEDQIKGLEYAIQTLKPKMARLLKLRFEEKKTFSQCCEEFEFNTSTRASQLINMALRELLKPDKYDYIIYGYNGNTDRRLKALQDSENRKSELIEYLKFDGFTIRNLHRDRIDTVGELVDVINNDMDRFAKIRLLGKKQALEIFESLIQKGLLDKTMDEYIESYRISLRKCGKGYLAASHKNG